MKRINTIGFLLFISFMSFDFKIISNSSGQKQKLIEISKEYKSFETIKTKRIVVTDSSKY